MISCGSDKVFRKRKSIKRLVLETSRALAKALEYYFQLELLKKEIEENDQYYEHLKQKKDIK